VSKRDQLICAAMTLLVEQGSMAFSMNALARHAKASKETLYRHFGNKQGLFEAIISENAVQAGLLQDFLADNPDNPEGFLAQFGETLLQFLMSPGSIVINRIVIAEATSTPELAAILEEHGRQKVARHINQQFEHYQQSGLINPQSAQSLTIFLGLLLQDSQIKVLDGSAPPLTSEEARSRAAEAASLYLKLFNN